MSGAVSFKARLLSRLEAVSADSAAVPLLPALSEAQFSQLERYYDLLRHWNRRINLTALPLEEIADQALDRLFIEPLCAARFVEGRNDETGVGRTLSGPAEEVFRWADLGSGGGSPAIPLKIACPSTRLTMVESRGRKAAFLREVVGELRLADVDVESLRAEDLPSPGGYDAITVRAVRLDDEFMTAVRSLLRPSGRLLLFLPNSALPTFGGFKSVDSLEITVTSSQIALLTPAKD